MYNGVSYNAFGVPIYNPFYVNKGSVKTSKTGLGNSGYNSSRLGFRGTEDLGGGLAASFWLEAPITNDDGATGVSTFARRSTVSLSGGFGEVRLGRDYTPTFWNDTVFDPFGTNGVGTNIISTANGFNVPRAPSAGGFRWQSQFHARQQLDRLLPAAEPGWLLRPGDVRVPREDQVQQRPGTPDVATSTRAPAATSVAASATPTVRWTLLWPMAKARLAMTTMPA
jgi:hypothetical protein